MWRSRSRLALASNRFVGNAWSHSGKSVAGDDGGDLFVALGDQIVEILVSGRTKGFEPEIVNDHQQGTT